MDPRLSTVSLAPEVKKESKLPKGPIAREMTEDEKKDKMLNAVS